MIPRPDPPPLPKWFARPESVVQLQPCLFRSPFQKALVKMHISADEVARWHVRGWLSFGIKDTCELDDFDDPRVSELIIIRDVLRSGLSDAQIECLLDGLPRPISMDPDRLAYSFHHGWVEAIPAEEPKPEVVIEECLGSWLEDGDRERLVELRDRIEQMIERLIDDTEEDE